MSSEEDIERMRGQSQKIDLTINVGNVGSSPASSLKLTYEGHREEASKGDLWLSVVVVPRSEVTTMELGELKGRLETLLGLGQLGAEADDKVRLGSFAVEYDTLEYGQRVLRVDIKQVQLLLDGDRLRSNTQSTMAAANLREGSHVTLGFSQTPAGHDSEFLAAQLRAHIEGNRAFAHKLATMRSKSRGATTASNLWLSFADAALTLNFDNLQHAWAQFGQDGALPEEVLRGASFRALYERLLFPFLGQQLAQAPQPVRDVYDGLILQLEGVGRIELCWYNELFSLVPDRLPLLQPLPPRDQLGSSSSSTA